MLAQLLVLLTLKIFIYFLRVFLPPRRFIFLEPARWLPKRAARLLRFSDSVRAGSGTRLPLGAAAPRGDRERDRDLERDPARGLGDWLRCLDGEGALTTRAPAGEGAANAGTPATGEPLPLPGAGSACLERVRPLDTPCKLASISRRLSSSALAATLPAKALLNSSSFFL